MPYPRRRCTMLPTLTGRRVARLVAAAVLALPCLSAPALANVRAAADVSLLGLSAGAVSYHANDQLRIGWAWLLKAQAARLEFGAEVTDNIGVTAGATGLELWALSEFSILPVSARLYWDFTPNELWIRRTAYITATYRYNNFMPDEPTPPPSLSLGVGATFTWYALTARVELDPFAFSPPAFGLLLGVDVGGSYIFGRHHQRVN